MKPEDSALKSAFPIVSHDIFHRCQNNTPPDIVSSKGALNANIYLNMFLFGAWHLVFDKLLS
jgi:hypothetical protein